MWATRPVGAPCWELGQIAFALRQGLSVLVPARFLCWVAAGQNSERRLKVPAEARSELAREQTEGQKIDGTEPEQARLVRVRAAVEVENTTGSGPQSTWA